MNDITYTFKKMAVLTDPSVEGYDNVIKKIVWRMTFTDGVSESIGMGETILDTSDLSNFINADEVTDEILEDWVINKEGGTSFIDTMINIHRPHIERKTQEDGLVTYYQDEDYNLHL